MDGNVKRVLTRVYDVDTSVTDRGTLKELWSRARHLVEAALPGAAGACNEALNGVGRSDLYA